MTICIVATQPIACFLHYCLALHRRQWSLVDNETLRYIHLNTWEAEALQLDRRFGFMSSPHQMVTFLDEETKVCSSLSGDIELAQ